WNAYAAPLGGPLVDAIDPRHPLPWADARHLLDQLVEEFRAAEMDGAAVSRVSLDQVWVEANGRVQLLDGPLSGRTKQPSVSPLVLLRQVASLALEGSVRSNAGSIAAPIPAHAVAILDRLFTDGGYARLADFQKDLTETHTHRPEVNSAVRAAHLGIQAALLAPLLAILFVPVLVLAPVLTLMANSRANDAQAALDAFRDNPAQFAEYPELAAPLAHPKLAARLEAYRDRMRADADYRRPLLLAPQRLLLEQFEEDAFRHSGSVTADPRHVREAIQWAGAQDGTPRAKSAGPWTSMEFVFFAALLLIPAGMVILAAVLRGGISMMLAGISLVRGDGRKATRRQCALRAAVVWLPIALLLFGAAWIQAMHPERIYLAAALWLIAVGLLPVYVVIAIRYPDRPPQDRIAGTYLMPA
ncbi:MAG TPA: hypothetical protein VLM40_01175, partial [Gemmata sp.]|nr:hypothetical protein [Gemmata sp.]